MKIYTGADSAMIQPYFLKNMKMTLDINRVKEKISMECSMKCKEYNLRLMSVLVGVTAVSFLTVAKTRKAFGKALKWKREQKT